MKKFEDLTKRQIIIIASFLGLLISVSTGVITSSITNNNANAKIETINKTNDSKINQLKNNDKIKLDNTTSSIKKDYLETITTSPQQVTAKDNKITIKGQTLPDASVYLEDGTKAVVGKDGIYTIISAYNESMPDSSVKNVTFEINSYKLTKNIKFLQDPQVIKKKQDEAKKKAEQKAKDDAAAKAAADAKAKEEQLAKEKSDEAAAAASANTSQASPAQGNSSYGYTNTDGWSVAQPGYCFISNANIYYSRVKIASNFTYTTIEQATASGARIAKRGNQYAQP